MNENARSEATLLLILPAKKELYPLNPVALTQAQAPRRELENDYRDALILDRDGILRRIEHVELLGPWGGSMGRKLLSRLTGGWRIAVRLSDPLPGQFERLKQLIADCICAEEYLGFPELDDPESRQEMARAVMAAATAGEVFDILQMPPPEDALDVL